MYYFFIHLEVFNNLRKLLNNLNNYIILNLKLLIYRFAAAVRWLIGPQLGISINNPTVECIILSGELFENFLVKPFIPIHY